MINDLCAATLSDFDHALARSQARCADRCFGTLWGRLTTDQLERLVPAPRAASALPHRRPLGEPAASPAPSQRQAASREAPSASTSSTAPALPQDPQLHHVALPRGMCPEFAAPPPSCLARSCRSVASAASRPCWRPLRRLHHNAYEHIGISLGVRKCRLVAISFDWAFTFHLPAPDLRRQVPPLPWLLPWSALRAA